MDLSQAQTLSLAAGNVIDTANLNAKGLAKTSVNNLFKNIKVKYPRLPKHVTTTGTGQKATVSFTLSAPDLSSLGLAAEGISKPGGIDGKNVSRIVDAALVFGGTAYSVEIPVNFKLSPQGASGQIVMAKH